MGCLDGSWLLETGKFSDFTIVCQNTEFRVHKAVLYPQSDYFAALFDSNMEEAQKGVVTFDDIDPKIMKHLIDFFYSDYHGFEFDHSELKIHVEVWILADRLQASPAMITIENRLMYHLEEYEEKEAAFYEENILDMVFSHPACAKSAVGKIFAETAWIVFSNEKDECSSHILTSFTKGDAEERSRGQEKEAEEQQQQQ
ncbi:POZ domain-containing protein [Colletotrichum sublineola]|nr:POZ domain-containing protein [Colletotrichum sublineola]